jgi:lipid II:glycine glycyltransferase (peptidoglycan interpeptide bridge formation enzyme)
MKSKRVKANVRQATDKELQQWNNLLTKNPNNGSDPYQSTAMSKLKAMNGWRDEYWVYETSQGLVYASVLTRKFDLVGNLAYIMRGPSVNNEKQLQEIVLANQTKKSFFAIKIEPTIDAIPELLVTSLSNVNNNKLLKVRNVQPHSDQVVIDLSNSLEGLWSSFRQGARREIRAAEKDGIVIKEVPIVEKHMQEMYRLYAETGRRAGFFVRKYSYHRNYWTNYAKLEQGKLFFAYPYGKDVPIAGLFAIILGKKAVYKDGGSIRSGNKHFAHLLQWEAMKVLKSIGVTEYNLMSTNTTGLANFKLSFSPRRVTHVGTVDQVIDLKSYTRWRKWGEKVHQAIAYHLRHTTLY